MASYNKMWYIIMCFACIQHLFYPAQRRMNAVYDIFLMEKLTAAMACFLRSLFVFSVAARYRMLSCLCCILPAYAQSQPPEESLGLVYQANLSSEERSDYEAALLDLLAAYENSSGQFLRPGATGRVALKVDVRKGAGLSTPLALVEAMVRVLEQRSFRREDIYLVAHSARNLQKAGFVKSLHGGTRALAVGGCGWKAWDQGADYDANWYYDSPLPPRSKLSPNLLAPFSEEGKLDPTTEQRKSLLPVPLMFDFDVWINLATAADTPDWGICAVLANATLANVSNARRFQGESVAAAAAIAEIAAIPELRQTWFFSMVSLHKYQYIGGPQYNAAYTRSEPLLWLSADPVALDRLLVERINQARQQEGFPRLQSIPLQLSYAASLGVGQSSLDVISLVDIADL